MRHNDSSGENPEEAVLTLAKVIITALLIISKVMSILTIIVMFIAETVAISLRVVALSLWYMNSVVSKILGFVSRPMTGGM